MKSLKIALAIALVATTAACGSKDTASPASSEIKRTPLEWQYITDVRAEGSEMVSGFSDDALLTLGAQTCTELDAGATLEDVIAKHIESAVKDAGVNDLQAAEFVASYVEKALVNFCSEFQPN